MVGNEGELEQKRRILVHGARHLRRTVQRQSRLADLTNVDAWYPSDGHALVWDAAQCFWRNHELLTLTARHRWRMLVQETFPAGASLKIIEMQFRETAGADVQNIDATAFGETPVGEWATLKALFDGTPLSPQATVLEPVAGETHAGGGFPTYRGGFVEFAIRVTDTTINDFDVQHSIDGIVWETVAEVRGAGISVPSGTASAFFPFAISAPAAAGGGGAGALGELSDVTLTTPAAGQLLRYDCAAWVNGAADWSELTGKPTVFPPEAHTHVAAEVSDFAEGVDDRVAALLVAGTNITITYDDVAGTLTVDGAAGSGDLPQAQPAHRHEREVLMIVDVDLLRTIAGGAPDESNMRSVVAGLEQFPAGLDQPHRFAHYLAQLMHESGRFRHDEEVWGPTAAQRRYEDRADLGHSAAVPGEAFAFRGRAGIQLTGRHNYKGFRDWCREKVDPDAPNCEENPDAVTTDPWEGQAPIWYWDIGNPTGRSLNAFADDNNAEAVTRKINGGMNGFEDRLRLYTRAALVLLGYKLEKGVVLQYQRDASFTGRDLDDIPGPRTRAAMHVDLKAAEPLAFGPAALPADLLREIGGIRELVTEAGRRLDAIAVPT